MKLGEITSVLRKGIFDIKADTYAEPGEGVPFIRIADLRNGIIDENSTARITEEAHLKEIATALAFEDLAISKTAYPAAALMTPLIFDSCITMPKQARLSWTPLFVSGWVT